MLVPPSPPVDARIRKAAKADADGIGAVHVRSWQSAYQRLLPEDFLTSLSLSQRQERWRELLANLRAEEHVLVVESEGEVLGFSHAGPSRDKVAPDLAGEVYAIYLDPTAVGKGVGRELFARTVTDLRDGGYRYATLWVLEGNKRARRFTAFL